MVYLCVLCCSDTFQAKIGSKIATEQEKKLAAKHDEVEKLRQELAVTSDKLRDTEDQVRKF